MDDCATQDIAKFKNGKNVTACMTPILEPQKGTTAGGIFQKPAQSASAKKTPPGHRTPGDRRFNHHRKLRISRPGDSPGTPFRERAGSPSFRNGRHRNAEENRRTRTESRRARTNFTRTRSSSFRKGEFARRSEKTIGLQICSCSKKRTFRPDGRHTPATGGETSRIRKRTESTRKNRRRTGGTNRQPRIGRKMESRSRTARKRTAGFAKLPPRTGRVSRKK